MKVTVYILCVFDLTTFIAACGGDGETKQLPRAPEVTIEADIKKLLF